MAGRLEIHLSPVMARWMEGARASGAAVAGEHREGERRGGLSCAREVQHLPAAFGFTAHAVEIPKGWRWVLLAQGIPGIAHQGILQSLRPATDGLWERNLL